MTTSASSAAGRMKAEAGSRSVPEVGVSIVSVSDVEATVNQRLAELLPIVRGDSVNDAIAVAVAIEHSFGIVLSDDELKPEILCDPSSMTATVRRNLDIR